MKSFCVSALLLISACSFAHEYTQEVATALREKNASLALTLLQKAEQANPQDVSVLLQTATTLFLIHDYTQAAVYYERALKLQPHHANTRYNCATAYRMSGNLSKALEHYETVYQTNQSDQVKSALFKLYIRSKQWSKAVAIQSPQLWWYGENIYGKSILLDSDKAGNGLGDVIQFAGYAQALKQAGAYVIVKAPAPLHHLLKRCAFIDQLITKDDPLPAYDQKYDICIASFLLQNKNRIMMRTPQKSYLTADPELVTFWSNRIANNAQLKVGLCWRSNFVRDRFTEKVIPSPRSISLEALAPLADSRIAFYSLQKSTDPIESPLAITHYSDDFDESHGRFMDTAALIMNMDVVITVDTSIAHLAGALGKPVWLLLSCEPDYRWFTDQERSPLYPDVHLFRQRSYGDWTEVVITIKQKLTELIFTHRNNNS